MQFENSLNAHKSFFMLQSNRGNSLNWLKSIKGKNLSKYKTDDIDHMLKKIRRTKPKQIGYVMEDLDEQIRQLRKAVEYIKIHQSYYISAIETEKQSLYQCTKQLENAKRFSGKNDSSDFSVNLVRNLQRELALLENNIRAKQKEIEEIRNSPKYFEFIENFVLVERYKRENEQLEQNEDELKNGEGNSKKLNEKELKSKIHVKENKLGKLSEYLKEIDKEILALKSCKNIEKIDKSMNDQDAQNSNEKLHEQESLIIQYKKEIQAVDETLAKVEENDDAFRTSKKIMALLAYVKVYMELFHLDNSYIRESLGHLDGTTNYNEISQVLVQAFDMDEDTAETILDDFANHFGDYDRKFQIIMFEQEFSGFMIETEALNAKYPLNNSDIISAIETASDNKQSIKLYHLFQKISLNNIYAICSFLNDQSNFGMRFSLSLEEMLLEVKQRPKSIFNNNKLANKLSNEKEDSVESLNGEKIEIKVAEFEAGVDEEDEFLDDF